MLRADRYAKALAHAHARCLAQQAPLDPLPELVQRATLQRQRLLADCHALQLRGRLPAGALRRLKRRRGYRNVAFDLFALAELIEAIPWQPSERAWLDALELRRTRQWAEGLLQVAARPRQRRDSSRATAELRQRAFSLFADAYGQIRKAVGFLRWEAGDANAFAPPLNAPPRLRRQRPERIRAQQASPPESQAAQR